MPKKKLKKKLTKHQPLTTFSYLMDLCEWDLVGTPVVYMLEKLGLRQNFQLPVPQNPVILTVISIRESKTGEK